MKLCFATHNAHKLQEIRALFPAHFTLVDLPSLDCHEDIPEPHDTFVDNAREKARYVWEHYQIPCFADDSGLEVAALNNEPGVYSARYAGPAKKDSDNLAKLLQNLEGLTNRDAVFTTVFVYLDGTTEQVFEGKIEGTITQTPQGDRHFGYDPIFQPKGYQQTFAAMPETLKNSISHRAIAFEKLLKFLNKHLTP